jgi:hypothetical protein
VIYCRANSGPRALWPDSAQHTRLIHPDLGKALAFWLARDTKAEPPCVESRPATPLLGQRGAMVVTRPGSLQETRLRLNNKQHSVQVRAPVSRRTVVALAAPSTKHRPTAEAREEQHASSSYVEASRTAEAVRSFDDANQSGGLSLQSASNLVRHNRCHQYGAVRLAISLESFHWCAPLLGYSAACGVQRQKGLPAPSLNPCKLSTMMSGIL